MEYAVIIGQLYLILSASKCKTVPNFKWFIVGLLYEIIPNLSRDNASKFGRQKCFNIYYNFFFFILRSAIVRNWCYKFFFFFLFWKGEEGVSNVLSDLNTVPTPTFSTPIGL